MAALIPVCLTTSIVVAWSGLQSGSVTGTNATFILNKNLDQQEGSAPEIFDGDAVSVRVPGH